MGSQGVTGTEFQYRGMKRCGGDGGHGNGTV